MAQRSTKTRIHNQHEALHHPALKPKPPKRKADRPSHEGATEDRVGDRTGPEAGYDDEPVPVKNRGGVA
jgi:hypothetical protein